jgi:CBS domain-containing protein
MEDAVFTVSPQAKGSTLADLLAERNVGGVPVVEEDRTLVGLVSEFDLLRVMDEGKDLGELAATDIMTRDVVTVTEEMPVKDVVHLLQERHLIRVPVMKRQGPHWRGGSTRYSLRVAENHGQLLAITQELMPNCE